MVFDNSENLLRLASVLDRSSWDATCRPQEPSRLAAARDISLPRRCWGSLCRYLALPGVSREERSSDRSRR